MLDTFALTDVETRVLRCLADGMQSKEIAASVGRCKPTIEGYIRTLYLKLHARSRAHLVAQAIKAGVINLEPQLIASGRTQERGW